MYVTSVSTKLFETLKELQNVLHNVQNGGDSILSKGSSIPSSIFSLKATTGLFSKRASC